IISLQISMHSLQMYTVGPAISFLTSFCDLPQNEQRNVSSVRLTICAGGLLNNRSAGFSLLGNQSLRAGEPGTGNHLIVTPYALVANECALADCLANTMSALRHTRHDVGD